MLIVSVDTRAQELTHELDSLIATAGNLPDSLKPERYNKISYRSRFQWPLIAIQNSLQAINWSIKTGNDSELSKAYSFAGLVERNIENYNEALRYYNLSLEVCLRSGNKAQTAHTYNNIGNLYTILGDADKARAYLDTALALGEKLETLDVVAYVCSNFGVLYTQLGMFDKAEMYLRKCAEARKGPGFSKNSRMQVEYSLADLYMKTGQLDSAKKYLYHFHEVYVDTMNTWLSDSWRNLSKVYQTEKQYDSALYCAGKARETGFLTNENSYVLSANKEINNVLMSMKKYYAVAKNLFTQSHMQDSIYELDVLNHKKYIAYSTEYLAQQSEIERKNAESRFNTILLIVAGIMLAIGMVMVSIMFKNFRHIRRLNAEMADQKREIDDSIRYACKIQQAILPDVETFGTSFSDKFLLFMPRDGVSGDFYWKFEDDKHEIIAVADCTGHGVPGASMSMIGTAALQDIVSNNERSASMILEKLRERIKTLLHQEFNRKKVSDGMDIALVVIDKKTLELEYAGAYNPLIYVRDSQVNTIKAIKNPIGIYITERPFKSEKLQLQPGDCLYMMSDGYTSQFGGPSDRKISMNDLKAMLLDINAKPMMEQKDYLAEYICKWRGSTSQVDDITIAGFRV